MTHPTATIAQSAKRLIDTHYRTGLDLDVLARKLETSRSSLCRAFRTAYDITPMFYLRQLRMAEAEELLIGTDLPVGQIAERCGFNDIYYFSRAFKQHYGQTPTGFRSLMARQ